MADRNNAPVAQHEVRVIGASGGLAYIRIIKIEGKLYYITDASYPESGYLMTFTDRRLYYVPNE